MLTQPLAPRGPCDLREKAGRHWESMLAAMLGDMVSLGFPSSTHLPPSAQTYQVALGLTAGKALEGWGRPLERLLPLAAVCVPGSHQVSHSVGDLKEDET